MKTRFFAFQQIMTLLPPKQAEQQASLLKGNLLFQIIFQILHFLSADEAGEGTGWPAQINQLPFQEQRDFFSSVVSTTCPHVPDG